MPDPHSHDPQRTHDYLPETDSPATVGMTGAYQPAGETEPAVLAPPAESPTIPGYRITGEIAKGGMGRVWAAVDLKFDRDVAIKTLLPGADAERFVIESKITAKLPHPGIPPVHDLGTLADGSPYLAMKLIHGQTLSALLKARPSPQDELSRFVPIFEQIAQAVGFAHSRGVIHRDLKPLNVMVGEFGEVQVMDWGLAKEVQSAEFGMRNENVAAPHMTQTGAIMGTPGYMAPEQARGEAVDARADVFALGSILTMILTSKPAFVGTGIAETLHKTVNADLADAHQRLATCGADAELVALTRRFLAANAEERPNDSREVASLIATYRANVEARLRQAETDRATSEAKAIEQAKRRRVVQWAGGLVAAVLLMGLSASVWQMFRAIDAEGLAKQNEEATGQQLVKTQVAEAATQAQLIKTQEAQLATEKQLQLTEKARTEAVKNLGFAHKGNELLGSVFKGMTPKKIAESGRPLQDILRENLVTAAKELEGSAIGDPLEVAFMQNTLGLSLLALGEAELAIEVLTKARDTRQAKLGLDHPDTLTSMGNLAGGYKDAGEFEKAVSLFEETLKIEKTTLGIYHPSTLISMNNLAAAYHAASRINQALLLYEETLKLMKTKLSLYHSDTIACMGNLATCYQVAGKLDLALPLLEETFNLKKAKLGLDDPDTLASMGNLALGYYSVGNRDQTLPLLEETLRRCKAKLGPDHPSTLANMNNLAKVYQTAGKLDLALPLYEEALKLRKAKFGLDHPDTLISMDSLAGGYGAVGKLDLALPLYEETLKLRQAKLGPDHANTLASMGSLARCYQAAGKLDLALPLYEETLKLYKTKSGPAHPDTLISMSNLALGYQAVGKLDQALPLFEETLKLTKAKLGPDHPDTLASMGKLALGYYSAGKVDQALPLYEETLKLQKAKLGPDHPNTLISMGGLAVCYQTIKQPDQALPLYEETFRLTKAKLGPNHPNTLACMNNLASGYRAVGKLDLALRLYEETLELRKAKLGLDHPDTIASMSNLASGYKAAGKLELALPLFEETLKLSTAKLGLDHPDTIASMGNLGKAYCDAKQGEKASATLTEFINGRRKNSLKNDPRLANLIGTVALELLNCEEFATAETMLRECLAIREKVQPESWSTFNTQSLLGAALLGQKKYADAELLLVKGYEGMKAREAKMPKGTETRIAESLDRLIQLSTATNKTDDVTKYKELRAKYPEAKK